MDDEMFSGIHSTHPGPKVSMLASQTPAVSVPMPQYQMLPNQLNQQYYVVPAPQGAVMTQHPAEATLKTIKTTVMYIVLGIVLLGVLYLYFTFKSKAPKYSGTALPGIHGAMAETIENSLSDPKKDLILKHSIPIAPPRAESSMVSEPLDVHLPIDDIITIHGTIPVWEDADDEVDHVDTRISENDASVAEMVHAREAFTKGLESNIAKSIKQQQLQPPR
jgi:hypothetical protein